MEYQGTARGVLHCDVTSLYPSIMLACDFLPQKPPRSVSFHDGDLGLVDRSRHVRGDPHDPAERVRWHAMFAWIADERGYKPGWVSHKFKEKFGTWPPYGARPEPIPPTPDVRSWVRSRQIAYARSQVA